MNHFFEHLPRFLLDFPRINFVVITPINTREANPCTLYCDEPKTYSDFTLAVSVTRVNRNQIRDGQAFKPVFPAGFR